MLGHDEPDHAEVSLIMTGYISFCILLQLLVDYIGAYRVKEWHGKPLRHLGVGGYFMLLVTLLTFILSLISRKTL